MFRIIYNKGKDIITFIGHFTFEYVLSSLSENWEKIVYEGNKKSIIIAYRDGDNIKVTKEGVVYFLKPDLKGGDLDED